MSEKNFLSIFSSLDLTFNNIWCILSETRKESKSGGVELIIIQREQIAAKTLRNPVSSSVQRKTKPISNAREYISIFPVLPGRILKGQQDLNFTQ